MWKKIAGNFVTGKFDTGKFLGRFRSIGVSLLLLNSGDYFQGLVLNLEMDSN